jgi:hypothetical protein
MPATNIIRWLATMNSTKRRCRLMYFAANMLSFVWGEASSCFHALFLYSICVNNVLIKMMNIGMMIKLDILKPSLKILLKMVGPFSGEIPSKVASKIKMMGTTAAAISVKYSDAVLFDFNISERSVVVRLMGVKMKNEK